MSRQGQLRLYQSPSPQPHPCFLDCQKDMYPAEGLQHSQKGSS